MLTRSSFTTLSLLAALTILASSCSDAAGPRPEMVAVSGTYFAHPGDGSAGFPTRVGTFTITENGVTTDLLDAGALIGVTLDPIGVTDGRLLVPNEIDARLNGTWTLEGEIVRLSHDADTFLRDMELRARNGRLEGEAVFDGVTVRVVLGRSG
jgi:hypothetical protein